MSYNIGAITINRPCKDDFETLIRALGLKGVYQDQNININEASKKDFNKTAVGFTNTGTLIFNHRITYNLSFEENQYSRLDNHLIKLSGDKLVFAFYMNGTTGNYGFSIFQNGERIRRRSVLPEKIKIDEGNILDVEKSFDKYHLDDEERIFTIAKMVLGESIFSLVFDRKLIMKIYE